MGEENKLSLEELENVSGGYIYYGTDSDNPWEVIDVNGHVISRHKTKREAQENAIWSIGGCKEIGWERLSELRRVCDCEECHPTGKFVDVTDY